MSLEVRIQLRVVLGLGIRDFGGLGFRVFLGGLGLLGVLGFLGLGLRGFWV